MSAPQRRVAARSVGFRDHVVGALLATAYVALLLQTSLDLAMSRDESFYFLAAENTARWIEIAAEDWGRAIEPEVVAQHWEYNHEHPALMKTLFALSWLAHQAWDVFPSDSAAFRFPGMVTGGLLLWLLYIFGARAVDRRAGLFAAGAFALMPRVFYHSHLDCFDIPIVFFLTLVTYLYWRSLDKPWWAVWVGISYGLALATKHNAWILPGVLLIHWVWTIVGERAARKADAGKAVTFVPWWLIGMLLIGPPLFVATWPWLWTDGVERWLWYANFHTNHVHYHMAYFGQTYIHPPFPISFPWVLTALTVPATTCALALAGLALWLRAMLPRPLVMRLWPSWLAGASAPDRRFTAVLWVGCLLAPMVVISLPSSPIFGGTKHWMPGYPFLALFAGVAFGALMDRVGERLHPALKARLAMTALGGIPSLLAGALLLAPAAVETVHSHPFGLSHYTFAAGHVPGSADLGMNRQFWGFTQGSLAEWLKEALPNGGSVWPCDATHYTWRMMQRDGMIPSNIRVVGHMSQADYILIHHEHHFAEVEGQAWTVVGSVKPVHVLTYDGVPIISVYERRR